MLTLLRYQIYW